MMRKSPSGKGEHRRGVVDGNCLHRRFPPVARRGMHEIQTGQTLGQLGGDFRMLGDVGLAVERLAGLKRRQIILHRPYYARIVGVRIGVVGFRAIARRMNDGIRFHDDSPDSPASWSAITCRNLPSARTHSFSTLSTERPIRLATSANGNPSKCRSTIVSR